MSNNITMRQQDELGAFKALYPETNLDQVLDITGKSLAEILADFNRDKIGHDLIKVEDGVVSVKKDDGTWVIVNPLPPKDDPSGSPGDSKLIAGSLKAGYFGVVPSSELITGDALATQVGITAGTSQYSAEGWLKFAIDGKIIFVAKKPIRHTISWDQIHAVGAVFGNKTVSIGDKTYKVRLMKGARTNPYTLADSDSGAIGSEWNRLMLPIHVNAPSSWPRPTHGGVSEDWGIKFTDVDLLTDNSNGSYTWCQETPTGQPSNRAIRGTSNVSYMTWAPASTANTSAGWRPVLELVVPGEDTSGSPGAKKTIAGDLIAGYFGVVPSSELITGDALASQVGITTGTSQHSNVDWLKFAIDGKIIFVAKKTIRHSISWDTIHAVGAALGTKTVTIGSNIYRVRLMKGAKNDPFYYNNDDRESLGSEWNRLMLPIHVEAPNKWAFTQYGGTTDDWGVKFTDADLHTHYSHGSGSQTLCQETSSYLITQRSVHGYIGASLADVTNSNSASVQVGWRPVLELMVPGEDTSGSPGATKTIAGNAEAGYFGVVPSSEVITGDALATAVGITAGVSQHNTGGWLKFIIDSKIVFVAKKPIRHTISWDQINAVGAVFGSKTVIIGGKTYRVRLMKASKNDPYVYEDADRGAIGSEWNRLMLPIHERSPNKWVYPAYAGVTADWGIKFTDEDLLTKITFGLGSASWCQESATSNLTYHPLMGVNGVEHPGYNPGNQAAEVMGWRPVLELAALPGEDTSGSPGATKTIAGTSEAGYFGVVPSSELITGDALATAVGITAGVSQHNDAGWLKFIIDEKIIFVAKKSIRYNINWHQLNTAGVVLGARTISISGKNYRVRLMKGALTNPSNGLGIDGGSLGSEWNRLMLPIHVQAPNKWDYPNFGGISEDWNIKFTDSDLLTKHTSGNGAFSWCQETPQSLTTHRTNRGGGGVSHVTWSVLSSSDIGYGWRPVLELI